MVRLVDDPLDRGLDKLLIGALRPGGQRSEACRGRQSQTEREPRVIQSVLPLSAGRNHRDLHGS